MGVTRVASAIVASEYLRTRVLKYYPVCFRMPEYPGNIHNFEYQINTQVLGYRNYLNYVDSVTLQHAISNTRNFIRFRVQISKVSQSGHVEFHFSFTRLLLYTRANRVTCIRVSITFQTIPALPRQHISIQVGRCDSRRNPRVNLNGPMYRQ